jgi:hypothetical protein
MTLVVLNRVIPRQLIFMVSSEMRRKFVWLRVYRLEGGDFMQWLKFFLLSFSEHFDKGGWPIG